MGGETEEQGGHKLIGTEGQKDRETDGRRDRRDTGREWWTDIYCGVQTEETEAKTSVIIPAADSSHTNISRTGLTRL